MLMLRSVLIAWIPVQCYFKPHGPGFGVPNLAHRFSGAQCTRVQASERTARKISGSRVQWSALFAAALPGLPAAPGAPGPSLPLRTGVAGAS